MKTTIKTLLLIGCTILLCNSVQSQQCFWSSHAGGSLPDGSTTVLIDRHGNTYTTGSTMSTPCYFTTDTVSWGFFIVKYDNLGNEVWIRSFQIGIGPNPGEDGQMAMVVDTVHDEILATGNFYGYMNLPDTVLRGFKNTIFLMKLDLEGNIIWYKTAGGQGDDLAYQITADPSGNFYISGSNELSAIFDQDTIPRGGFLANYDPDGNLIWVKNKFRYHVLVGSGQTWPYSEVLPFNIIFKNNTLFVNGNLLSDTIIIDTTTIYNKFNYTFISCFNSYGDLQWIQPAGPAQCGYAIGTDTADDLFITGTYSKKGVFGTDTIISTAFTLDCFLAKYDRNGNFKWVVNTKASDFASGFGLACSSDNGVYLGGSFSGSATFGDNVITTAPTDYYNMFLAKYSSEGIAIGVRQNSVGKIYGLCTDRSDNICLVGEFNDTLRIGPNTFISYGESDYFVAKCSPIVAGLEKKSISPDHLVIYANPNSGKCTIDIPEDFRYEKSLTLIIYNSEGKVIQDELMKIDEVKISLDIHSEAKGMYTAVLTNGKKSFSGKIVFK